QQRRGCHTLAAAHSIYSATNGALASGFVTPELHHLMGHDRFVFCHLARLKSSILGILGLNPAQYSWMNLLRGLCVSTPYALRVQADGNWR
ncbi:MAG: hypothetical protein EOS59_32815, partial [Mesorhizobium sp.]